MVKRGAGISPYGSSLQRGIISVKEPRNAAPMSYGRHCNCATHNSPGIVPVKSHRHAGRGKGRKTSRTRLDSVVTLHAGGTLLTSDGSIDGRELCRGDADGVG